MIKVKPRQPKSDQSRKIKLRAAALRWRRGAKRLPRMPYPLAQESTYAQELTAWTRRICRQIFEGLQPLLNEQFRQDESTDSTIGRLRAQVAQAPLPRVSARFGRLEGETRAAANNQVAGVTGGIPLWQGQSHATQRVLRSAVSENVALISSIPQHLLTQVEAVIKEGLADGAHRADMVSRIKERFGVAESRAQLIARDQIGKVNGQLAEARARDLGMETYIWRITGGPGGDGRVRPMHEELEGTEQRWDDPPVTNEEGDQNNPGEDFQCLPGDTQIAFAGAIDSAFRRPVCTNLALIVTSLGVVLRATPHHPVLTFSGWKAAKDVKVGDHLVQIQPEVLNPAKAHVKQRVAQAADIFDAFRLGGELRGARGVAAQFHHDGTDEEVDVVDIDRRLFNNRVAAFAQVGREILLPRADSYTAWLRTALGDLEFMLPGMGHAAHGSVGRLGDGQPLLASASGESEQVGGTTAADRHPDLFEVPEQGRSGDADTIRDALERFTGYVRANNCRAVPVLVTATDTELYAGFVYNFSAHVGWYSANGLVVHNCRCTAEPPAADLLEALLNAPDEPPTDELTPVDQAIAGLADAELDYLREGMRDLAPVEAAYAGATPEEVELISTGQSKTKNSVSAFDPIKIESGPTASGRQFTLTDGRHRLAAARKAGAKKIAAIVDNRRVVIPLPTV